MLVLIWFRNKSGFQKNALRVVPGQGGSNGLFKNARALRAAVWHSLARTCRHLGGGPAGIPYGRPPTLNSDGPFGLYTRPVYSGGLLRKWGSPTSSRTKGCSLPFAMATASVVYQRLRSNFSASSIVAGNADGRTRLAEINRAINLAIRPMEDLVQYGEVDVWSSPLVTFNTGAGDCEDYAIAKYVALQMAGMSAEDLRIVVVLDLNGEGHAVVSVRLDGIG